MNYEVKHRPEYSRFECALDGSTGYVEYVPMGDRIEITHTIVPNKIEGRGVASALVGAVYAYAREKGKKIVPSCYYARKWSERHPEYGDMTV